MVTICTSNSTSWPHNVFMCFVWITAQSAIISLHSMKWLVFITDTEGVYCAVRTGSLYVIQVNLSLHTAKKSSNHSFLNRRRSFKELEEICLAMKMLKVFVSHICPSCQLVKLAVAQCGESYFPGFLDTSAQRLSYRGESCRRHPDLPRTSLLMNHAGQCVSLRAYLGARFTSCMTSYQTLPGVLKHVHSMSVELPRSALRFLTSRYMTAHRVQCTGWNNVPSTEYFINSSKNILKTHVSTYCSGPLWGIL